MPELRIREIDADVTRKTAIPPPCDNWVEERDHEEEGWDDVFQPTAPERRPKPEPNEPLREQILKEGEVTSPSAEDASEDQRRKDENTEEDRAACDETPPRKSGESEEVYAANRRVAKRIVQDDV